MSFAKRAGARLCAARGQAPSCQTVKSFCKSRHELLLESSREHHSSQLPCVQIGSEFGNDMAKHARSVFLHQIVIHQRIVLRGAHTSQAANEQRAEANRAERPDVLAALARTEAREAVRGQLVVAVADQLRALQAEEDLREKRSASIEGGGSKANSASVLEQHSGTMHGLARNQRSPRIRRHCAQATRLNHRTLANCSHRWQPRPG